MDRDIEKILDASRKCIIKIRKDSEGGMPTDSISAIALTSIACSLLAIAQILADVEFEDERD